MYPRKEPKVDDGLSRLLSRNIPASDFINRDNIANISIVLTYRCPAKCAHCLFRSDINNTSVIDFETARRFIKAASYQDPPPSLSFSGGEPFLELHLMKSLAALAFEEGMISEVISSGAWVNNEAQAYTILSELKSVGLRTFCISVDRFHVPFVSKKKQRTALLASLKLGLHTVIKTEVNSETNGNEEGYLKAVLGIPQSVLEQCEMHKYITAPVGRARRNVKDFFYRNKDLCEGCPFVTEIVTLTPYGYLHPCCGVVVGESPENAKQFIQDNLIGKDISQIRVILRELKHDLFFKLLQYVGPYRLLQELRKSNPGLLLKERYVGSCDVCLDIASNADIRTAMGELLEGYTKKL